MNIQIVSDSVCPWCYIGKRRFEKALAERPDLDVEIEWRPFQLNPEMPPRGMDRQAYVEAKFGGPAPATQFYDNIKDAGEDAEIKFDFSGVGRIPNSFQSHRLIALAGRNGVQDRIVEALFKSYFEASEDIGCIDVLVRIAASAGLDADATRVYLEGRDGAETVRRKERLAREMGVSGVPCFIVNSRYAISGAQSPKVFLEVLDLVALEEKGEAPAASEE